MSKLNEIFNGYKNYLITDQNSEKVARERALICSKCEFAKKGLHAAVLPDYRIKEIKGYYCSKCKCPLSAKVRSKASKCPIKKW